MCRLKRLAEENENVCYPGQYDNDHVRWINIPLQNYEVCLLTLLRIGSRICDGLVRRYGGSFLKSTFCVQQ